jgi:hypothetical protein
MPQLHIDLHPPTHTLRQFALLCLMACCGVGVYRLLTHGVSPWPMATISILGILAFVGLMWPALVRPIFVCWMVATTPIRWFVAHLVLGFIFYVVITPLALLFRWRGRDVLQLRRPPANASCWTPKPPPRGSQRYLQQF